MHPQIEPMDSMHMVTMYGIGCFQLYGNLLQIKIQKMLSVVSDRFTGKWQPPYERP